MASVAPARSHYTLAQTVFPQQTLIRDAVLVLVASLFIAACAQISIKLPIGPVPITMQPFAVVLVGGLLGPGLGLTAAALYVAMGIFGLPVYAGQLAANGFTHAGNLRFGYSVITGGSGGYLISYPFVAAFVGWLAARGWDRQPAKLFAAMLLGNALIYAFGLPWLYAWGALNPSLAGVDHMTVGLTLKWGLLPFIPGDLAKDILAAGLVPSGWELLRALHLRNASDEATRPAAAHLAPVAIAAGLVLALGALLPWRSGHLGIEWLGGDIVLAAGLLGAAGAFLGTRRMIAPGIAHLVGFATGAVGALFAFLHLVNITATGGFTLAHFAIGVPVAMLASLVLLASTASEAAAEE